MGIFDYSIWWIGLALELILLARARLTKLGLRYPVFHFYIFFVLTQSLVRIAIYRYRPGLYSYVYWTTEFIGVVIGCGIVYEIYRRGLASFPGTARMARILLTVLFLIALVKAFVDASTDTRWWAEATTADVERALRTVQAIAIAALAVLFLAYDIPFGRNLKGILLGYGLFIGLSVIWFTFVPVEGYQYRQIWFYIGPSTYDFALSLWTVYLWSPQTQPAPVPNVRLEEQYQRVAARTSRRLQAARGYLGKVIDP